MTDHTSLITQYSSLLQDEYRQKTPRSAARYQEASRYLAGGGSRASCFFDPYPCFLTHGLGPRVYDLDGNEYLDFVNNFTVLVHGHGYPPIVSAIADQATRGVTWAALSEAEVDLARLLCARVPSLDALRFCNSGTEAAMNAFRLARVFTGREKILKMEGGFHGTYDQASLSVFPPLDRAGPADQPNTVPDTPGLPANTADHVVVAPYGDVEAFERAIRRHQDDLAAVVVEPVLGVGGMIPAPPEFLRCARELTARFGILLIFDEIITFRLAPGGAQEQFGVTPDLTLLGKAIGGGLPVAAFGGRGDVMALYAPGQGRLSHTGTYNGSVVTMAAGIVCVEALTAAAINRMNQLGEQLRRGFEAALREVGLIAQVTGVGSLLHVHLTATPVRDYRSAATARKDLFHLLHLALINRGIFTARRGMFNVSSVMGAAEIEAAVAAFRATLVELRPLVEAVAPDLIANTKRGTPWMR